jgi:hypothetical protein
VINESRGILEPTGWDGIDGKDSNQEINSNAKEDKTNYNNTPIDKSDIISLTSFNDIYP